MGNKVDWIQLNAMATTSIACAINISEKNFGLATILASLFLINLALYVRRN